MFTNEELIDAGVCPNCWGEQEYDGKAREIIKDKQVDVNNHTARHTFIKEFVVNHVDGIHLHRHDDKLKCERCGSVF